MDALKRFVLTLRLRNTKYTVVEQCAIFARMIEGTVVQGWATTLGSACCQHYWVVAPDGQTVDVGRAYSTLFSPELGVLQVQLSTANPGEGTETIGFDEPISQRNRELFELYTQDPKAFWKQVKPFRNYKV